MSSHYLLDDPRTRAKKYRRNLVAYSFGISIGPIL